jgi:hypothetical protein
MKRNYAVCWESNPAPSIEFRLDQVGIDEDRRSKVTFGDKPGIQGRLARAIWTGENPDPGHFRLA